MPYSFLRSDDSEAYVSHPLESATSRSRISDHEPVRAERSLFLDELPLLDIPLHPSAAHKKHLSVPYIVNIDELTNETGSAYEGSSDHVDEISHDAPDFTHSLRARLSSMSRYVRASGPANPSRPSKKKTEDGAHRMPTGWRLGTWVCCSATILCIIAEIALLIYAEKTSDGKGSGMLMEGNCEEVRKIELWLLLPLNIAGTILIGTSNYVMQVVCAPGRKEIDEAHALARPITVGGISFNDMAPRTANKLRRSIWWTLGLSSVPIHFLLNVAIYSSVQASNTGVLIVSDGFENDVGWNHCDSLTLGATPAETTTCAIYQKYQSGETQSMTVPQCMRQYWHGFQTNASSVIVVTGRDSQRWYTAPLTAEVPPSVSYGAMHCVANYCNDTSWSGACDKKTYTETSDNHYTFTWNEYAGWTTVALNFTPFCENQTERSKDVFYSGYVNVTNATSKSFGNFSLTSYDDLLLRETDALANITSIRGLFSAFRYRYWAVANITGDYLRPEYMTLPENRDPRTWLCPRSDLAKNRQCDIADLQRRSEWTITPNSMPVQGCYVLPKKELCKLRYSSSILIITICFDVVKLLAMIAAVTLISQPLMTLGDVIESFLRAPDQSSKGQGVLDDTTANAWTDEALKRITYQGFRYVEVRFGRESWTRTRCVDCGKRLNSDTSMLGFDRDLLKIHSQCGKMPADSPDITYFRREAFNWLCEGGPWWASVSTGTSLRGPLLPETHRWFELPSKKRWIWFTLFYLSAISLAIAYFAINFRSLLAQRLLKPWIVGFDAPDPSSLLTAGLDGISSIYGAAMLINSPQIAFSMLYFVFNATLTMMHTAHEWDSFAIHRKALRVSLPRGEQRSTYWLQLPWTYSIPLILISGSMHWLLSRSLYLVKVDVYGYLGEREADKDYFACGYSPVPALLLIFVLGSIGITLGCLASRRLRGGMPLVRLNSLAIAAACHPDPEEKDLELKPLMWGELEEYLPNGKTHYSFSAKQVVPLKEHPVKATQNKATSRRRWPFKRIAGRPVFEMHNPSEPMRRQDVHYMQ